MSGQLAIRDLNYAYSFQGFVGLARCSRSSPRRVGSVPRAVSDRLESTGVSGAAQM